MPERLELNEAAPGSHTVLPAPQRVPRSDLVTGVSDGPLTDREKVATIFAGVILGVIVLISAVVVYTWFTPPPVLTGSAADQTAALQQYKTFTDVLNERSVKLFDLLVTKALLPLFATLIGFILGKQSKAS